MIISLEFSGIPLNLNNKSNQYTYMAKEDLDWQELDKFVRRLLKITTSVNSMKTLVSKRDGSKTRFYKWRRWRYHDNFITRNGHAAGQGILYYDKKRVFSTVYFYSFAENTDLKLLKFLGEAILDSYDYFSKNPSKTTFNLKKGPFEYQRTMKKVNEMGNLTFENDAKIKENGETVYFAKDISGYLIY